MELLGNDRGLHDGEVEEIALEHEETCALLERRVIGADHLAVACCAPLEVLRHGLARHGGTSAIEFSRIEQFAHDRRHAACAVEALAEKAAGRLHIGQQGDVVAVALPVVGLQRDTGMFGHGHQVWLRIGRAADGGIDAHGIEEGFPREDV